VEVQLLLLLHVFKSAVKHCGVVHALRDEELAIGVAVYLVWQKETSQDDWLTGVQLDLRLLEKVFIPDGFRLILG
jgi:hypothetical protein